jgi:anti-sigma28 factor (negative regulator of flagellin synthesis)
VERQASEEDTRANPDDHPMKARQERLEAIKASIESGTYVVEPEEISRKIIDAHLSEKARP